MSKTKYLIKHKGTSKFVHYENDRITWVELEDASQWDDKSACAYLIDVRIGDFYADIMTLQINS